MLDLEEIDGNASSITAAGPLGIHPPGLLKRLDIDILEKLVNMVGLPPIFGFGELLVGPVDVELARAQESSDSDPKFCQYRNPPKDHVEVRKPTPKSVHCDWPAVHPSRAYNILSPPPAS